MKIAVDLHIHSALSPCADDDMTPNNIVNMAMLKKLDAISVTDHNSCDNVESILRVADSKLIVVPGMEVQTREEVHLLCYFTDIDRLWDFGELIRSKLPDITNVPEIFGNQLIMDQKDRIIGQRKELLISSVDLSLEEILDEVNKREGALVPAHIDRPSHSVISQLGFMPESLRHGLVEISRYDNQYTSMFPAEKVLYSSDAHYLWEILERVSFLEVDRLSIPDLICTLARKNDK